MNSSRKSMGSEASSGLLGQLVPQDVSLGQVLLALFTIATVAVIADYARMLYMRVKMPPGPLPWPIIGNTFSLPANKPWIYFETLAKRYNAPLITFWIGRNPTIWLCGAWAASELLDKRAGIYASRPRMVVFGELGPGQSNLVTMRTRTQAERERWRVHRRLTHLGVGVQQVRKYRDIQNNESKVVALDLLSNPSGFVRAFERYATSVVSIIAFGRRVGRAEDPIITEVIDVMQLAADLNVPGTTFPMLMETFPILAKVPAAYRHLMPWMKRVASRGQKGGHYFFYALAKEADQKSEHDDCYVKMIFNEKKKYNLQDEDVSSLTGNLFGAGSDTSSSTLITFILACCAFPEALRPACEELDRVVGPHRSPHFDDMPNLPYVSAFVKEVLRWRSVAIIGGQPHSPTADDYYTDAATSKTYWIPKDSWVQGNVWAIHRNEREFPEPDRFEPRRFIKGSEWHREFPGEKGYMTFGWGRRVCSGQALAEQGTWITVARLLWGFRIRKALDSQGKEVDVDIFAYTNGLNMRPEPFECRITPRTEEIKATIEKEGRQALEDLIVYEGESEYRMSDFYQGQKKKVVAPGQTEEHLR